MGFGVIIASYLDIWEKSWNRNSGRAKGTEKSALYTLFMIQPPKKTLDHADVVSAIVCLRINVSMKQLYSCCVVCKVLPYLSAVPHCHFNA